MLDGDGGWRDGGARWDGDLDRFRMRATNRESEVAAAVLAHEDGSADGWLNLRHVGPGDSWMVWLRLRNAAARIGCEVMFADELRALAPPADDRASG